MSEPKELTVNDITMCAFCGGPLLQNNHGNFYRVTVAIAVPNPKALQERYHLAGLMGGSGALAEVFASTRAVAFEMPAETQNACFDCATSSRILAECAEHKEVV